MNQNLLAATHTPLSNTVLLGDGESQRQTARNPIAVLSLTSCFLICNNGIMMVLPMVEQINAGGGFGQCRGCTEPS